MIARFTASPATEARYFLGEGPVWDAARGRLLWVDIVDGNVHEGLLGDGVIDTGRTWSFERTVGAVAAAADGTLLVAERETLTRVGPDDIRTPVARVLPDGSPSRLNDGAVDPAGRFLVGSLAHDDRRGEEVLVRLSGNRCTTLDADLTLSNGLAWSPAGDRLYSVDTIPGVVWARDYDATTGAVGAREALLNITDGDPDGLCTDADGNLWLAIWGRGRIQCHSPSGELLAVVDVDAPHTSSVAFAGPDLDVLVITTAIQDLAPEDLAKHPNSGRLFTARVDAVGLPSPYWNPSL